MMQGLKLEHRMVLGALRANFRRCVNRGGVPISEHGTPCNQTPFSKAPKSSAASFFHISPVCAGGGSAALRAGVVFLLRVFFHVPRGTRASSWVCSGFAFACVVLFAGPVGTPSALLYVRRGSLIKTQFETEVFAVCLRWFHVGLGDGVRKGSGLSSYRRFPGSFLVFDLLLSKHAMQKHEVPDPRTQPSQELKSFLCRFQPFSEGPF